MKFDTSAAPPSRERLRVLGTNLEHAGVRGWAIERFSQLTAFEQPIGGTACTQFRRVAMLQTLTVEYLS